MILKQFKQASRGTMNQHHSALSEILEKKNGNKIFGKKYFFSIFEKLFTLYTEPKLAKIRPKIGFSQAKRLFYPI